jgi:hypothetical protein
MRTNDPTEPERFQPLGEKIPRPAPFQPEWKPKPGSPGILENSKGEMKTDLRGHQPSPFPWMAP